MLDIHPIFTHSEKTGNFYEHPSAASTFILILPHAQIPSAPFALFRKYSTTGISSPKTAQLISRINMCLLKIERLQWRFD